MEGVTQGPYLSGISFSKANPMTLTHECQLPMLGYWLDYIKGRGSFNITVTISERGTLILTYTTV